MPEFPEEYFVDKKISIIVPIYNLENYLEKCVSSILDQTYSNIEVILVNDGSNDDSGAICDRYMEEDDRVLVIHKSNGGVVSARKAGIEVATGEYIGFVDGDDWIDNCMYEVLAKHMEDVELVCSGYCKVFENGTTFIHDAIPEGKYQGEVDLCYIRENMIFLGNTQNIGIYGNMCNKLFLTSLLRQVSIYWDTELVYGEDMVFLHSYILKCKSLYVLRKAYYNYYMRSTSAVHTKDEHYLEKINQLYLALKDVYSVSLLRNILMYKLQKYMMVLICRDVGTRMGFYRDVCIPWYIFPYDNLNGKRIALYGAGAVGQDYYTQIMKNSDLKLTAWVDRNWEQYRKKGMEVIGVSELEKIEYDYLIIAIKHRLAAEKIKHELYTGGGIGGKGYLERTKKLGLRSVIPCVL